MTQQISKKGFSGLQVFGIAVLVMIVAVAGTIFAARAWFFPRPFKPVVLSQQEEKRLERKLEQFERPGYKPLPAAKASKSKPQKNDWLSDGRLKPEAYSEKGASREINLSERELNGLLAKNTDLARKVAIDLSNDLVSARLLLPVDPLYDLEYLLDHQGGKSQGGLVQEEQFGMRHQGAPHDEHLEFTPAAVPGQGLPSFFQRREVIIYQVKVLFVWFSPPRGRANS